MKKNLLFFLPILLLLTNSIEAQVTKHKRVSNFGIPSYIFAEMDGTFDYNYYEGKAGDYVKHGPFSINGSQRLQQKGFDAYDFTESYSATGQYSDGYLDGTIKITRNVTNHLKKISFIWTLTMNFKNGEPHGEWKSTYEAPGYPEATSHAICHFTNASMTGAVDLDWNAGWGDFSSYPSPIKMRGNLSDNSEYIGTWFVDNNEFHFEPGYLYRSILRDGDGKLKEPGTNELEIKYQDILHSAAVELAQKTLTEDSAKQVYNIGFKDYHGVDARSILDYFGGEKIFSRQILNEGIKKQHGSVVFYTPCKYVKIVALPTISDYMFQVITKHWRSKGLAAQIEFIEESGRGGSVMNINEGIEGYTHVDYKCPTCWWDDMVKYYFTNDQKNELLQIADSVKKENFKKELLDCLKRDGAYIKVEGENKAVKYTSIQVLDLTVDQYYDHSSNNGRFSATFKGMRDNFIVEQFDVTATLSYGVRIDDAVAKNVKYIPTVKSESVMIDQLEKKVRNYGDTVLSRVVKLAKAELYDVSDAEKVDSANMLLSYRVMLHNTVERCAIHNDIIKKHYEVVRILKGYKNVLKAYAAYSEGMVGFYVPDNNTSYSLQLTNSNKTEKLKLEQLTTLCSRLQNINLDELDKSIKSEKKNPQNQQKLLLGQN